MGTVLSKFFNNIDVTIFHCVLMTEIERLMGAYTKFLNVIGEATP